MKFLISGSRHWIPLELYNYIFTLLPPVHHILIHVDAVGVDNPFAELCKGRNSQLIPFLYLKEYGRAGGPLRNQQMIDNCPDFGIFLPASCPLVAGSIPLSGLFRLRRKR